MLRKAFRKQIRAYVNDQVGIILMGHRIPGSEEAYFDRKDVDFLRKQYSKIDWNLREPDPTNGDGSATEIEELTKEIRELKSIILSVISTAKR